MNRFCAVFVGTTLVALSGCGSTADAGGGAASADTNSTSDTSQLNDGSGNADTLAQGDGPIADAAASDTGAVDSSGGDATPADTSIKYPTCVDLSQCVVDACATNKPNCQDACLTSTTQEATVAAVPLLSCVQEKCVKTQCKDSKDQKCMDDCVTGQCMNFLLTCIDNGKTGAASCSTAQTCFQACPLNKPNSLSCLANCYNGMSAIGKGQLKAFGDCAAKNPGPDPTQACGTELIGCLLADKAGPKGCYEAFDCTQACPQTGPESFNCIIGCAAQLTKKAQLEFLAVSGCFGKKNDVLCNAKFVACADPIGKSSCTDSIPCLQKCAGGKDGSPGPGCIFKCLHDTTPDGASKLVDLMNSECPNNAANCPAKDIKALACIAPNGTKTCFETALCAQACAKDNSTCVYACLQAASLSAAVDAQAVMGCGDPATDVACIAPAIKCLNSNGKNPCWQLAACLKPCDGKNQPELSVCQKPCWDAASPQAETDFFTAVTCNKKCTASCSADKDPPKCVATCMQGACAKETAACTMPPG